MAPPTAFLIRILSRSIPSSSLTDVTASTTNWDKRSFALSAPFPVIAVDAIFSNISVSDLETSVAIPSSISFAFVAACR